jgi:hypothetical protein
MAQLYANGARSVLTASITATSAALQINPADEGLFPVAAGADWFKVAVEDSSGNIEYIKVQRATGQAVLTVMTRAVEDSAKFPARLFNAGAVVQLRLTAADLVASIAHPNANTGAHAATAISVTPAGGVASNNVQAAIEELDAEKQSATGSFPYSQLTGAPRRYVTGQYVFIDDDAPPAETLATNGQTIGSAASGATARANADCEALFAFIWRTKSNTIAPIQNNAGAPTTRGASAAADFAANKRLPLPDLQDGEALVAAVSSAVGARTAGQVLNHTHTGSTEGTGDHAHSYDRPTVGGGSQGTGANPSLPGVVAGSGTGLSGAHNHSFTTDNPTSGGVKNKAAGLYTRVYIAL